MDDKICSVMKVKLPDLALWSNRRTPLVWPLPPLYLWLHWSMNCHGNSCCCDISMIFLRRAHKFSTLRLDGDRTTAVAWVFVMCLLSRCTWRYFHVDLFQSHVISGLGSKDVKYNGYGTIASRWGRKVSLWEGKIRHGQKQGQIYHVGSQ